VPDPPVTVTALEYGTVTSPVGVGHVSCSGGFTVIVHDGDTAVAPVESVTVMRYVTVPAAAAPDTVPLMTPVVLLMVSPVGSVPVVTA